MPSPHAASTELIADITNAMQPAFGLADLTDVAEMLKAHPSIVHERLRFLTRNEAATAELASTSYRHQNGFLKIKLFVQPEFTVRLHIWPLSGRDRGENNPHGHRWEFASWIMIGDGLVERTHVPCKVTEPGARAYHRYEYRGSAAYGGLSLEAGAWLREERRFDRPGGSVYACPRETVHTIAPCGNDLLATVVVQGPVVDSSVPVYAVYEQDPRSHERRTTVKEITTYLAEIDDRSRTGV